MCSNLKDGGVGSAEAVQILTFSYGFDNKIFFNCKLLVLIFTETLIVGDVHPIIEKINLVICLLSTKWQNSLFSNQPTMLGATHTTVHNCNLIVT